MRIYEKIELGGISHRFDAHLRRVFGLIVLVKKLDVSLDNRLRVLVHAERIIYSECEIWVRNNITVDTLIYSEEH